MSTFGVKLGTYAIGTQDAINAIKIIASRRISQLPIIRQDYTSIPVGKMQPLRIDFQGTVVGSDYTSLRSEIMLLRRATESSRQSLYLDDERYVRVVSSSFDYSFLTTDFCNYNVRFVCEVPYFLAETVSSYVYPVAASGITFPVTNDGDVRVPLKVSMYSAVAGIDDDFQFENVTSGLLCKYRGVIADAETLVIDAGYDQHNVPTYKVELEGAAKMGSFEGDFIWIATGDNYLGFTGAVDGTVTVYWREGFLA